MRIINQSKNTILAKNTVIAKDLFMRLKGLLGRKEFNQGEALIIESCDSIHTFFMSFPIDVVFVNKKNIVVKTIRNLKPWRLSGIYFSASRCIELPGGTIERSQTCVNDRLCIKPHS